LKVCIIGLGLIGGSLGLALRAGRLTERIVGYDRNADDLALALERGAIDEVAADAAAAVRDADLVVLATPVLAVRGLLTTIAPHLALGAVVTDVASTKSQVLDWASLSLPKNVTFVGGHPMAGSEKSGMAAARPNLFRGAVYCVTPSQGASELAVQLVERLATGVGARPLRIDALAHDAAVAGISHVPFLAATALVRCTTHDPRWRTWSEIAATGYRDATRLASGDPAMYRDICLTNAAAVEPMLRELAAQLNEMADHLADPSYLDELFVDARDRRDAWMNGQARFRLP
jgi:prephenate dehydrogenase